MQFNYSKNNNVSGFTLIETLVAITVFTFSVLAILSVLASNFSNTNYTKGRTTAIYLAQEGVEYVRNIRDTYALYSGGGANSWNDFVAKLDPCDKASSPEGCYLDIKRDSSGDPYNIFTTGDPQQITNIYIAACTLGCPEILFDEVAGEYNYALGDGTDYTRQINVANLNDKEMIVFSTVSWNTRGQTYQVSFSEVLSNWAGQ